MGEYAKYQAGTPSPETELSAAQRLAIHDAARQPGRVIVDGNGTRIETAQAPPVASPQEKASDWLNSMTDASGQRIDYFDRGSLADKDVFVQVGSDRMSMAAAKAAGLIKRGPSGELINVAAPQ